MAVKVEFHSCTIGFVAWRRTTDDHVPTRNDFSVDRAHLPSVPVASPASARVATRATRDKRFKTGGVDANFIPCRGRRVEVFLAVEASVANISQ
jgi:hypothetical protein